jgi:hypothetical protein
MTCAVCQQTLCQHNDMEYSGIMPARHAGAQSGRTCGAGLSLPTRERQPQPAVKNSSFHVSTINDREANVCVR